MNMSDKWEVPPVPDYRIDLHAFSSAKDVNMTFFNELSDTQLMAVIEAYEIGKQKIPSTEIVDIIKDALSDAKNSAAYDYTKAFMKCRP